MQTVPTKPLCDFCSQPAGTTCFLSADRAMKLTDTDSDRSVTVNSDAHWVACPECATLVRKRDRIGLATRSYQNAPSDIKGKILSFQGIFITQSGLFWPNFNGLEHPLSEHPTEEEGQ